MEQLNLFADTSNESELIRITDGEYIYIPNFFGKGESDVYLKTLLEEIQWKQESMNMYGKMLDFPRLTAWYGDNDKPYSFSGII